MCRKWLSVALVVALSAVVGVYAATTQNVKSSFNVTYNVEKGVAATVTAYYQEEGGELTPFGLTLFGLDEKETVTKELEGPEIVFDADVQAVRYIYFFLKI